jgi:hypothetical protein
VLRRHGGYGDADAFAALHRDLMEWEAETGLADAANRLFYFAVPPSVFLEVATSIKVAASFNSGWIRLVVEKPFGHDYDSCERVGCDDSNRDGLCPDALPPTPLDMLPGRACSSPRGSRGCSTSRTCTASTTTWARRWCRT